MENNALKGELSFTSEKSQNDNQGLIITDKFKNSGTVTVTQIYQNSKNDDEKIMFLSSEYVKLQSEFLELKNDYLNYLNKNSLNEVPVLTEYTRDLNIELDKKI